MQLGRNNRQMKVTPLGIDGAWLVQSPVLLDDRGYFREWFKNEDIQSTTGINFSIQQANLSFSHKGVIRGIHYSLTPTGQAKWLTCVTGSVLDVIVDIRPNSPTYKRTEYIKLLPDTGESILIGPGLGHGFMSLEEPSVVSYLLSSPYAPEFEYEISPRDSELNIEWQLNSGLELTNILSKKDSLAPSLENRRVSGLLPTY